MTLTELFTNIANAIRAKTGSTEPIIAEDFPSAIEAIPVGSTIDLDEEIATQEEKIASQDELIASIAAALEGKAVGGGKTTKTIYIDWSGDEEGICYVEYISNGQYKSVYTDEEDVIEAEGGVVYAEVANGYYSDNFISFQGIMVATQDGETIYPMSSGEQEI